jgi:hypothetical protein
MKVVEQLVEFNFAFWPKVQIGPYLAQIGTYLAHFTARHVFDALPTWSPCMHAARHLLCHAHRLLCRHCCLELEHPSPLSRPPSLALALLLALAARAGASAMDGRPSLLPPASSPLQALTAAATCTTAFTSSCYTSHTRSPKLKATGALWPGKPPPVSRCSAWPYLLGPPRGEPQPPPTNLLQPTSTSSSASSVLNGGRDLGLEFERREGPNCIVCDSYE